MNFIEFEIVEFIKHEPNHKSTFYSIKLKNKSKSEAEKFFEKFEVKESEKIEYMVEKRGCIDSFFDDKQSSKVDNISCLPQDDLRLYCLRFGKVAVILGSGDYKRTRTYQESDELSKHVSMLQGVYKLIDERVRSREIIVTDNSLEGNLSFFNT